MANTRKPLSELTLMDDYMFAQVMRDVRHLKPLLEQILGIRIASIRLVEPQKGIDERYDAKAVRLDVYVEDEDGALYNVEVQTTDKGNLARRMRYYQSIIDVHVLHPGADYKKLEDSYVIFICGYDPFGAGRYVYTFEGSCREEPGVALGDGAYKVVVNTRGSRGEIGDGLREVVEYLNSGVVGGEYTQELDDAVNAVKSSEERQVEYMMMSIHEMELREEGLEKGLEKGREEGLEKGREEGALGMLAQLVREGLISLKDACARAGVTEEALAKAGAIPSL